MILPSMAASVPRFKGRRQDCTDQCCAKVKKALAFFDLEALSVCRDHGAEPRF